MARADALTSYGELAEVLTQLPQLVRAERRRRQLSARAAADELGIAASTVGRIEAGEGCALGIAIRVLVWLAQDHRPGGAAL